MCRLRFEATTYDEEELESPAVHRSDCDHGSAVGHGAEEAHTEVRRREEEEEDREGEEEGGLVPYEVDLLRL